MYDSWDWQTFVDVVDFLEGNYSLLIGLIHDTDITSKKELINFDSPNYTLYFYRLTKEFSAIANQALPNKQDGPCAGGNGITTSSQSSEIPILTLTAPSLSRLGNVGYGCLSLHGDLVPRGCPWFAWGFCLRHCLNLFLSHFGPRAGWAL